MEKKLSFVMAGGGTGGHVFPLLAVARELAGRGHDVRFIGTRSGIESRLVPEHGFPIQYIRIGGLNRVGVVRRLQSLGQLPISVASAFASLCANKPAAIFSLGGYAAGPVMIAARMANVPIVIMEPNAVPGLVNRKFGSRAARALLAFDSARRWFPSDRVELTGLPVRREFFEPRIASTGPFRILVTGGSRGSRTLNRAARESWALFRGSNARLHLIHQTGAAEYDQNKRHVSSETLTVEVIPFIQDMATAFRTADLVICRAGAGALAEIAAAGLPSILVPLPFAADDHQRVNAEALVQAGAARMVLDRELTGERLFREVERLRTDPAALAQMSAAIRQFARPGAATRAATVLEEVAAERLASKPLKKEAMEQ